MLTLMRSRCCLLTAQFSYTYGHSIDYGRRDDWANCWTEDAVLSSGEKRWDATTLGQQMATDIFRTRAPGLR